MHFPLDSQLMIIPLIEENSSPWCSNPTTNKVDELACKRTRGVKIRVGCVPQFGI